MLVRSLQHVGSARRRLPLVLAAVLATLVMSATAAGTAAAQAPQITATPGLFPAFNPSVSDYVSRCQPANQVQVTVTAPAGTSVAVDNAPSQTGSFVQTVAVTAGQEFAMTVTEGTQTTNYYVRCLPSDFPPFTATRRGPTQAAFYVMTPDLWWPPAGVSGQYVAFFDNNGVPVWWMRSSGSTFPTAATLLPNGDVAWTHAFPASGGMEEHSLDGTLVRTLNTVGGTADQHEVQLLPNGDYLMGRTIVRYGVDLSGCGGSTRGRLMDYEIQELSPGGALVWSWLASAHIPVTEVPPLWQSNCNSLGDIYHVNSLEPSGNGFVVSFRNLDAIYMIDQATGAIEWKLGGTPTPESLTVLSSPYPAATTFCGQHDARVLPDGSLTVYDDATGCNRSPRDLRFTIDPTAGTATLVESLKDPFLGYSGCCGSARKLPGGDWVTAWGATKYVTEQTASGAVVFQLSFGRGLFSYRAVPVLPGQVSISALRAGMDAQYPR